MTALSMDTTAGIQPCPACATTNRPAARFCRRCGQGLEELSAAGARRGPAGQKTFVSWFLGTGPFWKKPVFVMPLAIGALGDLPDFVTPAYDWQISLNGTCYVDLVDRVWQRTGDDTSGSVWERTRVMGVNTLAFRIAQHGTFFAADADCAAVTKAVPWHLAEQWLRLLAQSGTPLFVSASPAAIGPAQEAAIRAAFALAAEPRPVAEPLDWLQTTCPEQWSTADGITGFTWYDADGVETFR